MLGRMTADYDELEEENEKLKEENKKLKGEIEIRVLSQSENATRIIIKSFKEEIVELKDKIDNLKAEGYFE
jgi:regulator of replication initiation timing